MSIRREIKFRAWDKIDKEMVSTNDKSWGFFGDMVFQAIQYRGSDSRYSVMQYIGLKDSNGADIYEGDLVEFESQNLIGEPIPNLGMVVYEGEFRPVSKDQWCGEWGARGRIKGETENLEVIKINENQKDQLLNSLGVNYV